MSNLFWKDTAEDVGGWFQMLEEMSSITESQLCDEAWSIARQYEEIPHGGNVFQSVLLDYLEQAISNKYPFLEIESSINARDTHFYVNGQVVGCMDDLNDLLASEALKVV